MLCRYVRDWKSIEAHIGTKTVIQVCNVIYRQVLVPWHQHGVPRTQHYRIAKAALSAPSHFLLAL